MTSPAPAVRLIGAGRIASGVATEAQQSAHLDRVFGALSDPIRRRILERLDGKALLVSELAEPFDISLQGVSRHIQVLVRTGLVQQARSGRITRCSLDAAALLDAAVWLNRYTQYWQQQLDLLGGASAQLGERTAPRSRLRRGRLRDQK